MGIKYQLIIYKISRLSKVCGSAIPAQSSWLGKKAPLPIKQGLTACPAARVGATSLQHPCWPPWHPFGHPLRPQISKAMSLHFPPLQLHPIS